MPTMPGNRWRGVLQHSARSKTPEVWAPKSPSRNTVMLDSTRDAVEPLFEANRPPPSDSPTPTVLSVPTFDREDTESTYKDHHEDTPRHSRPKLTRYISDYWSFGNHEDLEAQFSSPWDDNVPQAPQPVDSLMVIQAVRAHLRDPSSRGIPAEHSSGVLRVFEDYRKVREDNDRIQDLLRQTLVDWIEADSSWSAKEDRYQAEIRRLELIIANGSSGMAGLIKARQGTVVRRHRRTVSTDRASSAYDFKTPAQLDEAIRSKSHMAHLLRPTSPSGRMAAMSRKLQNVEAGSVPIGTPPLPNRMVTLSRRVKSELNLTMISKTDPPLAEPQHSPPEAVHVSNTQTLDPVIESDAFLALRELSMLVARRKGINTDDFSSKIMDLLRHSSSSTTDSVNTEGSFDNISVDPSTLCGSHDSSDLRQSNLPLQDYPCRPQTGADSRQRHFSFEPGDDQVKAVHAGIRGYEMSEELERFKLERPKSKAGSQSTQSSDTGCHDEFAHDVTVEPTFPHVDIQKPSKIPSPLQGPPMGRPRRETSLSSLRTVSGRLNTEDPRASRSSVLTAFRDSPIDQVTSAGLSRSNSHSSQHPGQQPVTMEGSMTSTNKNSAALAAARAASGTKVSRSDSTSTTSAKRATNQSKGRTSTFRNRRKGTDGKGEVKDSTPQKRS